MPPDRMRVLVLALASLVLLAFGSFVLAWQRMDAMGTEITLSLRSMDACVMGMACLSVPFNSSPHFGGLYATFGSILYFGTIAFGLLVAWQAGTRVLAGVANPQLSRVGYGAGVMFAGFAGACGYLLTAPTVDPRLAGIASPMERGWGPIVHIVGLILGIVTLYYAVDDSYDDGTDFSKPLEPPIPKAQVVSSPDTAAGKGPVHGDADTVSASDARPASTPLPANAATPATPSTPSADKPPVAVSQQIPLALRNRLRFMVSAAEITRGGIDARREDGSTVLVMWRDVVGAVARRLPPMHDNWPFVDIVSTAGSTLRIAPFTRLTGEALPTEQDDRLRSLLRLVLERSPSAKLDAATRQFLESPRDRPAQLPDAETLAAHDNRLS